MSKTLNSASKSASKSVSGAFIIAPLALAALTAFTACSGPKEKELTAAEKQEACKNMIDTVGMQPASAEAYINGRDGIYKLTNLNVYQETKVGEQFAYFAARASVPLDADPLPTPTPVPSATPTATPPETPAETPTPGETPVAPPAQVAEGDKPAEPPAKPGLTQIKIENEILSCSVTDAISEGEIHADIEAPLAISPKDGKVAKELPYKVIANFQIHGEKSSVSEKSSAKSTTDVSSSELSPIADCAAQGESCKLFSGGKKTFLMRIEQSDETSKKILVAVYRLGPVPKREEPKQPQDQAPK